MHTSDFSCISATPGGQEPSGPPIFGYNSDPAHEDVPFPDYSYWGHEYTRLRGDPAVHSWCYRLWLRTASHMYIDNSTSLSRIQRAKKHVSVASTHFLLRHVPDADEYFYYWHGWDLQYKWIRHLYSNVTLAQRHPETIWRGRVADDDYPERDALR